MTLGGRAWHGGSKSWRALDLGESGGQEVETVSWKMFANL